MILALEQHNDHLPLSRVAAFLFLLVVAFAESGFAYFPVLYGSVPKITLILFFILCLYYPRAFPLGSIFIIGIIHDLVQANALGYSSALFILARMMVLGRRDVLLHSDSSVVWYEFTGMMLAMMLFTGASIVTYKGDLPAFQPLLFQFGLTILIFPLINWLFHITSGVINMILERDSDDHKKNT